MLTPDNLILIYFLFIVLCVVHVYLIETFRKYSFQIIIELSALILLYATLDVLTNTADLDIFLAYIKIFH